MKILLSFLPFFLFFTNLNQLYSTPKHLIDLRELEENVDSSDNSYSHRHIVVTWKGKNGADRYVSHTYCSGLIEALLNHSYGFTNEEIAQWFNREHPRSENFYDAIITNKGFQRITNLHDIMLGDIIVLKYPKGAYFERGDSTGHVMVVDSEPYTWEPTPPLIDNTRQWVVNVIDSSKTGHGKNDTRYLKRDKYEQGLGKGIFRIYTDESNRIVGYAWSTSKKSDYYPRSERGIAVGRLIPHYKP